MVIVETSIFTRLVRELLSDDEYRHLQGSLVDYPDRGALIRGAGGLRKIRWAAKGVGKRGGVRVIYYWATAQDRILMLYIYSKNEADDLTPTQVRTLRQIVEEEYP
jgi:mRNA-degrading endonuclease RelE of RelBE toxin-antitoxin system